MNHSPVNTNPYDNLPPSSFWKTAVAEKSTLELKSLWKPKFFISQSDGIITAGSCFAQHISKALCGRGYNWLDFEPPPEGYEPAKARDDGYGVFSFRTGNIYTVALLKQWLSWSLGLSAPPDEIWRQGDRYLDPFRPTIPGGGFASVEELLKARNTTLEAIDRAFHTAQVFVFTLGLTEAWVSRDNHVYPMCPGTVGGEFDQAKHYFKNFKFNEIYRQMSETIELIKGINPSLRILLTVSPVPLTATATNSHVLIATTYSKSTLRSVAGELASDFQHVDYFPAYEIITGFPFKGIFFQPNLRNVCKAGVSFVMEEFFGDLQSTENGALQSGPGISEKNESDDEAICEDALLEFWSKHKEEKISNPSVFIIGDSHFSRIANQLKKRSVFFVGGPLMWGSKWSLGLFNEHPKKVFVPTEKDSLQYWDGMIHQLGLTDLEKIPIPVVTNIGSHTSVIFGRYIREFMKDTPKVFRLDEHVDDLKRFLEIIRAKHFKLLAAMVARAPKVIWVPDPLSHLRNREVYRFFNEYLASRAKEAGCEVLDCASWSCSDGNFLPRYRSEEMNPRTGEFEEIHGNELYYSTLVDRILALV